MLLAILVIGICLWRHPFSKQTRSTTPADLEKPSTHLPARDTRPFERSRHCKRQQISDTLRNSPFHRTIIDNNLFRPLGWTPPRPKEPYRLIGTILPRDENTPPKAIIETTAGNKTYSVTIGENLDPHTEVVDIQPKQVTISTDGKQRTLKLPIRF